MPGRELRCVRQAKRRGEGVAIDDPIAAHGLNLVVARPRPLRRMRAGAYHVEVDVPWAPSIAGKAQQELPTMTAVRNVPRRTLTGRGFSHLRVDDGEGRPGKLKMTPILVADGTFDPKETLRIFEEASGAMDPVLARTIRYIIATYPQR